MAPPSLQCLFTKYVLHVSAQSKYSREIMGGGGVKHNTKKPGILVRCALT
jgi:hypothetical protein